MPPPGTTYVATSGRVFKGRFYSFLNFLGLVSKKRCYFGKVYGFTLAEVLVTLGIIGVVAALTIPAVITNYQKQETLSRLKKAYSIVQQAIKLSEVENGDIVNWLPDVIDENSRVFENWYLKYLDKHITSTSKYRDTTNTTHYNVALSDGSGFNAYSPSSTVSSGEARAYFFYCLDFKNCKAESYNGKDTFLFTLCADGRFIASSYCTSLPSRETILQACKNANASKRQACTALIQYDGWVIKKDYPWRK